MTERRALDARALVRLEGIGGPGLRRRVIALFLEGAPVRLAAARAGAESGDRAAIREALHALRSSAANVGAVAIEQLAAEGERRAAGDPVDGLRDLVAKLDRAFEEMEGPLREAAEDERATRTVAVVEDNPDNRLLVRAILEPRCRVVEYATGPEAIAGCQAEVPDVILLDISLPGMGGAEVLQHLRAQSALDRVPIIALTAHAMHGAREEHLAMGFDDYMAKPILEPQALRDLVQQAQRR